MKITKLNLTNIMEEIKEMFEEQTKIDISDVNFKFVSKEDFIENARNGEVNKSMIQSGLIQDFEKEYPAFIMVYKNEKIISISDEIAKDKLKKFDAKKGKSYLIHAVIHEITHLKEKELKALYPDMYAVSVEEGQGNELATAEFFAEDISYMFGNNDEYEGITEVLWNTIFQRQKSMELLQK